MFEILPKLVLVTTHKKRVASHNSCHLPFVLRLGSRIHPQDRFQKRSELSPLLLFCQSVELEKGKWVPRWCKSECWIQRLTGGNKGQVGV